jgi:hypothetical protein
MNGMTRAAATLLGAAAAGVLLWAAAQIGRNSTGGYWAAYAVVAAAGLVLALSQLRGRTGHPRAMLALGFLPVLIVSGWVLIAMEPHSNWFRDHVLAWSGDIGIRHIVLDVGLWIGVLAFGIGYTLGATLEPTPRRRVVPAPTPAPTPTHDGKAADEPVTAERREVETTTETPRERAPAR